MDTIDILEREHGWIGSMADCLETLVAEAKTSGRLPEVTYELLFLYESFVDGRHQDKEEGVLFPELLDASTAAEREVLRKLLADHEAERAHMAAMRMSLLGAVHGEPAGVRRFVHAATDYMNLHRAHMSREEATLLPMAERLLTPQADARVAEGFHALEGGPGDPHGVGEQVRLLLQALGLPTPPAA